MLNSIFDQMEFGPLDEFLQDDDVTDISYSNGGQVWLKTLSSGIKQVKRPEINNAFMESLLSNVQMLWVKHLIWRTHSSMLNLQSYV